MCLAMAAVVGCGKGESEYKAASDAFIAEKAAYETLDKDVKEFEAQIARLSYDQQKEILDTMKPLREAREAAKTRMNEALFKMQALKP